MPSSSQGAILALLAAGCWGGGDFSGGMGARAESATIQGSLRIIITAYAVSILALGAWLGLHHGAIFQAAPALWALGAGGLAGLSVAAFYIALAQGEMGASAALSGLLAAAIPAVIGALQQGMPRPRPLLGFVLAGVAIWYIAVPPGGAARPASRMGLWLAVIAGLGFGLYFTGLKLSNTLGVVEPLLLARLAGLLTCLLLLAILRARKAETKPSPGRWLSASGWLWAVGVAVLDSAGNLFYLAATRAGRLDIAAVLAALYPASTILLAAVVLRERPARRQWMGMALAAAAVVLITL